MTPLLECGLFMLIIVLAVSFAVLTVFLVKFLKQTSATLQSVEEITDMVKEELKPTIQSANSILNSVKNITDAADKNLTLAKKALSTVLGASYMAYNKFKKQAGFLSGIISGFKLLRKK